MKPKIGVPQLWYYPGHDGLFETIRISYPDGSVEVRMETDTWEHSCMSEANQKKAVDLLISYDHEFICNVE